MRKGREASHSRLAAESFAPNDVLTRDEKMASWKLAATKALGPL